MALRGIRQEPEVQENQSEDIEREVFARFDEWVAQFEAYVHAKGKVRPGKFRAFGYEPPSHRWADAKLKWRSIRMSAGHPPSGSSPAAQEERDLSRDVTFRPKRSARDA